MVAAGGIFKFHPFNQVAHEVLQRTGLRINVHALGQLVQDCAYVRFPKVAHRLSSAHVGLGPLQLFHERSPILLQLLDFLQPGARLLRFHGQFRRPADFARQVRHLFTYRRNVRIRNRHHRLARLGEQCLDEVIRMKIIENLLQDVAVECGPIDALALAQTVKLALSMPGSAIGGTKQTTE